MKRSFLILFILLLFVLPLVAAEASQHNAPADFPSSMASGTLPVIYIDTEEGREIVDKVTPVPAECYIDPTTSGQEAVGSAESPVALTIRGRGNYTWQQVKKPYKLKFDKKISLFGLPKSKHYALLAHIVSTSDVWAANEMAFEMARRIGMPWAPHTVPVELVLNGEYMGVYFLSETVRIDKGRVDIFEQEDGETDPGIIPYGWLVELDNFWEDGQLRFYEYDDHWIIFTFKSPEELSAEQRTYIENELRSVNAAIHDPSDPDRWTDYIDSESAARYFIIREILQDTDGYNGSFYITKDKEDDAKWQFGPLWDCTAQTDRKDCYMPYWHPHFGDPRCCWIPQMMHSPAFEKAVREEWGKFYTQDNLDGIMEHMEKYGSGLDAAFAANNLRWKELPSYQLYDREKQLGFMRRVLFNNSRWIDSHLDINAIAAASRPAVSEDSADDEPEYYTIDGIRISGRPDSRGIYIERRGSRVAKIMK